MVGGVKALILLLVVLVVGCASTPVNPNWVSNPNDPNNVKIEKAIRKSLKKPEGELTKADLEKVTALSFYNSILTDVKGLEKLTKLETLELAGNPALTKAQIAELQKALPRFEIHSNPKK